MVLRGPPPETLRQNIEAWAGCISGALEEETYRRLLEEAGFVDISFEVTRTYSPQDSPDDEKSDAFQAFSEEEKAELAGKVVSAFVRARTKA